MAIGRSSTCGRRFSRVCVAVQNCCFLTVALLEELQNPLWCVSAPVCLRMALASLSRDYGGEHFLLERRDAGVAQGAVPVPVSTVNRRGGGVS